MDRMFFKKNMFTFFLAFAALALTSSLSWSTEKKAKKVSQLAAVTTTLAAKDVKKDVESGKNAEKHQNFDRAFKDALISAYLNNETLQSELYKFYARTEVLSQALAGWRPQVALGSTASRSRTNQDAGGQNQTSIERSASVALEVTQNLYAGGETTALTKREKSKIKSYLAEFLNSEQEILFTAARAHLDLIFRKRSLKFNEQSVSFFKKQLKFIRDGFEEGERSRTNVAEAEAKLAQAQADLSSSQQELENAKATYVRVVRQQPIDMLENPMARTDSPINLAAFIEEAREKGAEVQKNYNAYKAAQADIDVSEAAFLPKVDVTGSVNRSLTDRRRANAATVQGRLSIPLYQKGAAWSGLRQKHKETDQAHFAWVAAQNTAEESAIKAWQKNKTAQKRVQSFKRQVSAAKRQRDGIMVEAKVGERTYLDVLEAQQQLLRAQVSLAEAQRDLRLSEYEMLLVQGRLTIVYLKLLPQNKTYQLEDYATQTGEKLFGL